MGLETLISEFASDGVGEHLYRLIVDTVRAVVLVRSYPPAYSPNGRWDEDAFTALAHDWVVKKLLQRGGLEYLLIANETVRGFRTGLELSFVDFLIGQKKRTELDHLFRRANAILHDDDRFRALNSSGKKASRLWGLARWSARPPFDGPDEQIIAAAFRLRGVTLIRYRDDARKLSPVVSDADLAAFLAALLEEVGSSLSLNQFATVFKYRFNLLGAEEVSLDRPLRTQEEGQPFLLIDTIPTDANVEDVIARDDLAGEILGELPLRQKRVLLAYAEPDATLTSVAKLLGCSKSTVDNDLHQALGLIRQRTDSLAEADDVHRHLLSRLSRG